MEFFERNNNGRVDPALLVRLDNGLSPAGRDARAALNSRVTTGQGRTQSNDDLREETLRLERVIRESLSPDGRAARDEVVLQAQRLVRACAQVEYRDHRDQHHMADLRQEGQFGLLSAVLRYDVSQGNQFETFAEPYIRGAIRDYIATRERFVSRSSYTAWQEYQVRGVVRDIEAEGRIPTAAEVSSILDIDEERAHLLLNPVHTESLDNFAEYEREDWREESGGINLPDDTFVDPHVHLEASDTSRHVRAAVQGLSEQDAYILTLRHGLDRPDGVGATLAVIGRSLGITPQAAKARLDGAEARLRQAISDSHAGVL